MMDGMTPHRHGTEQVRHRADPHRHTTKLTDPQIEMVKQLQQLKAQVDSVSVGKVSSFSENTDGDRQAVATVFPLDTSVFEIVTFLDKIISEPNYNDPANFSIVISKTKGFRKHRATETLALLEHAAATIPDDGAPGN